MGMHRVTRVFALTLIVVIGISTGTCRAQIFWTYSGTGTTDEIRRSDLDGQNAVTISNPTAPTTNPSPWAIGLHIANQHVFYSDIIAPRTIYRVDFMGPSTPTPIVTTTSSVFGIAVDSGNNHLYLSAQTSILRAGVDGSNQQTLLSGLLNVEGIAIDVPNNWMYFVERDANRIGRANLDGTNVVTISDHTSLGATTERGLALASNGKLFFADAGTDNIYMVNTNDFTGTPLIPTSIVNLTALGGGAPNGVATDNTYVYWAEGASPNRGIYRALMDGSDAMNLIPQTPGTPLGVGVIPVPEPSSLLTMLMAAGGAYFHCRKRYRSDYKTAS
jgi:hypothetical protein